VGTWRGGADLYRDWGSHFGVELACMRLA
jgi:hypothetical protein